MGEARIRAATATDVAAIVGIVALRNEFPPSGTASRTIWRRLGWKRNGRTSRRHQTIFVWAGESVDLVNDIPSAAEIIDHIVVQEADTPGKARAAGGRAAPLGSSRQDRVFIASCAHLARPKDAAASDPLAGLLERLPSIRFEHDALA